MSCGVSLKIHILDVYLDQFKENMGAHAEEQGESVHEDMLDFKHLLPRTI